MSSSLPCSPSGDDINGITDAHATTTQASPPRGGDIVGDITDHTSLLDYSGSSASMPQQLPAHTSRGQYSPHGLARAVAHTLRRAITHSTKKSPTNGTNSVASTILTPETSFSSVSTQSTSGTSSGTGLGSPKISNTSSSLSSVVSRSNSPPATSARLPPPITTWSLQSMLGLTAKHTTPGSFSSQSSVESKSKHGLDPQLQETVDSLVAKYMDMPDLQQSGMIDASRTRRGRLGLGPKRREKCDIYYEVFGTGSKKLFLIMGMVGCTMYWRLQTRYFANLGDYTICVFDNCGSGKSTIASGPYKITQLAKDACMVLEHLGWSQDIHLVGVSLGGMIAQEMCLMNTTENDSGPRYASVALVDTWHSSSMALPTAKEVRFAFKGMSALGSNPKHLIDLVFSRRWANADFHDTFKDATSTTEPADGDKHHMDAHPSNRDVMTALFRAIQVDLNQHRAASDETRPLSSSPLDHSLTAMPRTCDLHTESVDGITASAIPIPFSARCEVVADLTTCTFDVDERDDTSINTSSSRLRHSRSVATMSVSNHRRSNVAQATSTHVDQKISPPISKLPGATRTGLTSVSQSSSDEFKREVSGDLHQFMACLGHTLTPARVKSIRTLNPKTRFLVIHGEKDKVIRPACGRTLAKLLACPIVWINGAGHMPLIDAHCTFNLVLRAFTRDESWLNLPDRTSIVPASWDEQVRVRRWIMASSPVSDNKSIELNIGPANGSSPDLPSLELPSPPISPAGEYSGLSSRPRRISRIEKMVPVGPLSRELLVIDEADAELAARIIPANCVSPNIASPTLTSRQSTFSSSSGFIVQPTRELVIYGTLMDAPIRIRRYSQESLAA